MCPEGGGKRVFSSPEGVFAGLEEGRRRARGIGREEVKKKKKKKGNPTTNCTGEDQAAAAWGSRLCESRRHGQVGARPGFPQLTVASRSLPTLWGLRAPYAGPGKPAALRARGAGRAGGGGSGAPRSPARPSHAEGGLRRRWCRSAK